MSGELIEDHAEQVSELFKFLEIVPLRCEFLYHQGAFEYIALSPRFPEIGEGEEAPMYTFAVTTEEGKIVDVVIHGNRGVVCS